MKNSVALLIIDMQTGAFAGKIMPPVSGAESLLANVVELIKKAREANVSIIFIQHNGEDRNLADLMISYWVNFAFRGNPNGKALPKWRVYNPETRNVLGLGNRITIRSILKEDILEFYSERFEKQRGCCEL